MYISSLFSNQRLLSKYNKEAPRTWEELLTTSEYIYNEEQKINNTIIRYQSSMNDYNGSVALFEFINSFRESNNSPYPEIKSEVTVEAMKYLKKMKNEIGEEIFKSADDNALLSLFLGGDYLFVRSYYNVYNSEYKASILPGKNENVTASVVNPTNIAINKYIDEGRKKAAAEFIKFVVSKETQKKYLINYFTFSAITELYDDEEVCSVIQCEVIKDALPFQLMSNDEKFFSDDTYHII